MTRPKVKPETIEQAIGFVKKNLEHQIEKKGDGAFASNHEIYGALAEEMMEYLEAIHGKTMNIEKMKELSDIAVGAIFGIASLMTGVEW